MVLRGLLAQGREEVRPFLDELTHSAVTCVRPDLAVASVQPRRRVICPSADRVPVGHVETRSEPGPLACRRSGDPCRHARPASSSYCVTATPWAHPSFGQPLCR